MALRRPTAAVGAVLLALALTTVLGTVGAGTAAAAPGSPGTPDEPATVYVEDFENVPGAAGDSTQAVIDYQSASGTSYTASQSWRDVSNCNGLVANSSSTDTRACSVSKFNAYGGPLMRAIGLRNGASDPGANYGLLDISVADQGSDTTLLATSSSIKTTSSLSGRFVSFGIDIAATTCDRPDAPNVTLALVNDGTEAPTGDMSINPCTDPRGSQSSVQTPVGGAVRVGRYASSGSTLVGTAGQLGFIVRNLQTGGQGNDMAFDNVRVLDATPQLDKAFSPARIETGGTSTLTFTVTNTSELAAKNGWSFIDALPAGVVVANPANTATTCPAGVVTPSPNGRSISATGNLNAGQQSCTLSVDVTSSTIGVHTNGPDNVTPTGLNPPGETTLTVAAPTVSCTTDPNIFSTGSNGNGGVKGNGTNDAHWAVAAKNRDGYNAPNGLPNLTDRASQAKPPPADAVFEPAEVGKVNALWSDSPYGNNAQWISADYVDPADGVNQNGPQSGQRGDWYYRYQFDLADEVDPASFALAINFLADNTVYEVYVNGVAQSPNNAGQLPQPSADPTDPYQGGGFFQQNAANLTLKTDWKTGLNTIDVQMKSANPAEGFDAQVRPSQLCPTMTVTKNVDGRVSADDQFTVGIEDADGTSLASATTTGTDTTVSTAATVLRSGSTYTITDAMAAGSPSKISHYDSTIACTDQTTGQTVATTGTGPTWQVTTPNPDNYTCVITNVSRGYSVTKTADPAGPARPGGKVTYTVTVANTGQTAYTTARPAVFTDDLSKVLDDAKYDDDAVASTGTVTYTEPTLSWSGPLAVGASETVTYSVTVDDPDAGDKVLANAVTIPPPPGSPPGTPPDGTCVTCTTSTPVQSFATVKKADRTDVVPGQKVTYTITVTNTGKADYTTADPASFTDDLSAVLDDAAYNNDADNGATYAEPTISWSGALAVGQTVTVTYSVTIDDPDTGDKVLRNAVVTPPGSGGGCPAGSTDPDCSTQIPGRELQVRKVSSVKGHAAPGQKVTYTVTVKNTGGVAFTTADPATFTDDLSGVLDDATYNKDASKGATLTGTTLTWSGPLAVGATVTVTYSVTVEDPDTGDRDLKNAVTVPGDVRSNCPGADCTTDDPIGSYEIVKKASRSKIEVGDTVSYTITVTNTGGYAYTGDDPATFDDNLEDVLDDATYRGDATATAGATSYDEPTLTWAGPLPLGGTVTVTYTVTADKRGGDGTLLNVVTTPDPGGRSESNCSPGGDDPDCRTSTGIDSIAEANGGGTAVTGSDTQLQLLVAALLLTAGCTLALAGRRRRRS